MSLNVGRVLLAQQTASADASLDFDDVLSSDFDVFEIELISVQPATDIVYLDCQLGVSGSTYLGGASDYYWAVDRYGAGTFDAADTRIALTSDGTSAAASGNDANGGISGTIKVYGPTSSSRTHLVWALGATTEANGFIPFQGCGMYNTASSTASIKFLFSSGNIASGTIKVYGVR